MSDPKDHIIRLIRQEGLVPLKAPLQLRAGAWSWDFIDVKRALCAGEDLEAACHCIIEAAAALGADFDAIGGLTMGADKFAHVTAVLAKKRWFAVRKSAKGRGTNQRIEGALLGEGVRVLLVEDCVTTGASLFEAYEVVLGAGAEVVGAITMVDRGDGVAPILAAKGIPYSAVITYRDLDIKPVRAAMAPGA